MNRDLSTDKQVVALSTWAVAITLAWTGGALAAEAPSTGAPAPGGLQEIIVTAQKRAETEQSVPLSMTTFNAAALQQKEITEFFDYATKVP
ncbi:MAG TPA: hypothetical protein VNH41_12210, partial [Steroidobacteraceae bacterium]|nr:hypothetical protein [Steroidobacteraceae bacterium]